MSFVPHNVVSYLWNIPATMEEYWPNYDFEEMEGRGGVTLAYENLQGVNSDLLL